MFLVEAQNVGKSFRARGMAEVCALADVSLAIPRGSFAAITGPSGSGKTTLLAILGALDRPSCGTVHFDGRDLARCSEVELARVRRRIGFIFQDYALIPDLPTWENITYPLIPRGIATTQRQAIACTWLKRLGIADKWSAVTEVLSGGEQQRVAIARAFAGAPEILLADEPTSNLDSDTGRLLLDLLQEFHRSGRTVVVSTHDRQVVDCATHVSSLYAGRLVLAS